MRFAGDELSSEELWGTPFRLKTARQDAPQRLASSRFPTFADNFEGKTTIVVEKLH